MAATPHLLLIPEEPQNISINERKESLQEHRNLINHLIPSHS
jgi:hypothetical protein